MSSSPSRNWLTNSATRGSRLPHSKLLSTSDLKNIDNSGIRRSSAVGIRQRPPLPPTIGTRSHSLDGLLDSTSNDCNNSNNNSNNNNNVKYSSTNNNNNNNNNSNNNTAEGVSTANMNNIISNDSDLVIRHSQESNNKSNRRSRSMDDLLDDSEDYIMKDIDYLLDTFSNKTNDSNYSNTINTNTDSGYCKDDNDSRLPSISPSPVEQPCGNETIIVENTLKSIKDDGTSVSTTAVDDDDDDTLSTYSCGQESLNSNASNKINSNANNNSGKSNEKSQPKTFMNRYVKKVKSLMKK